MQYDFGNLSVHTSLREEDWIPVRVINIVKIKKWSSYGKSYKNESRTSTCVSGMQIVICFFKGGV